VDPTVYFPIIILVTIGIILIAVALHNIKRANRLAEKSYRFGKGYRTNGHRYVPGQFSNQMELDMRLPYRRFRQLYPETRWTYEEYKKMQMQTAFRRSYSSQDNKRMVR
jgi:hypothetical protein